VTIMSTMSLHFQWQVMHWIALEVCLRHEKTGPEWTTLDL
jgi:hypothetical protein